MIRYITFLLLLLPTTLQAQFTINNTSITVQSGALFTIDSLTLQPSSTLTLTNTQFVTSTAAQTTGNGLSIERVYSFTNPPNFSGTIQLRYADGALGGNTETSLQVAHSIVASGNTWIIATGSTVNTTTNVLTATLTNATLARMTATSASNPLPVELIEFTARKDDAQQIAKLAWTVGNELDFDSYSVERSADARTFEQLGTVKALGKLSYEFADDQPLEGINYYRLKMNDLNGSFSYSGIRSLQFAGRSMVFTAYPNPVKDELLTISTTDASAAGMNGVVMDLTGRVIQQFSIAGRETRISTNTWIPGNYILKLQNGFAFRIVKQ